jgi:pimeloyl-ACP methyl ester carboxylesterase
MVTTIMTAKPYKRHRLRKVVLTLLVLAAIGAGLFYWRPTKARVITEAYTAWRIGLVNHEVKLGNYRIHYMVAGQGKPLVLVHGLAGRAEEWLSLIPEFTRDGYQVYAIDLLGYGRSEQPDVDYSIALETDILRQFLDSQNLHQPDIAGWSMGGWISLKFAAEHPDRVHRLILMDSAGLQFDAVNAGALRPKTEAELAHMFAVLSPNPKPVWGFVARDILRNIAANDWIVGRALQSMGTGKDLMDNKMQSVSMPVLIIWGKEDMLTPLSIGERMRVAMPQSLLYVYDGTGHLAPTDRSEQVSKTVVSFLKADPPLAAGEQEVAAAVGQ